MKNNLYMQVVCPYNDIGDHLCAEKRGTLSACQTCNFNQPLIYTTSVNTWQCCPICNGTGQVSSGFYNQIGGLGTQTNISECCRTCNGKGIVSILNGLPPADGKGR